MKTSPWCASRRCLPFATGDERCHVTAVEAMRYLAAGSVALQPLSAGILLADQDANQAPIHVTIVGSPASHDAIALHTAALRSIASHELIEIRDPSDRLRRRRVSTIRGSAGQRSSYARRAPVPPRSFSPRMSAQRFNELSFEPCAKLRRHPRLQTAH